MRGGGCVPHILQGRTGAASTRTPAASLAALPGGVSRVPRTAWCGGCRRSRVDGRTGSPPHTMAGGRRLVGVPFKVVPADADSAPRYEVALPAPITLEAVCEAAGLSTLGTVNTGEGGTLELESDEQLNRWVGARGARVVVQASEGSGDGDDNTELTTALEGQVEHMSRIVECLRAEKQALIAEQREQARTINIQQHRITMLEQALRVAEGLEAVASPTTDFTPTAAPTEPPAKEAIRFDPEYTGASLDVDDTLTEATATHSYNKLALCEPGFDTEDTTYAEFTLTTAFSRFTAVGIVMEDALGCVNVNTDGLGESDFSYAWNAHKYWTSCFTHQGQSQGPRGGEWAVGSRVGVLVANHCVSFYLDGQLRHQHVFRNVRGRFRFGVGFGGPKVAQPDNCYGSVRINADEL